VPNIVRAALVQTAWTGDKESMVEKSVKYAYDAAEQGAQVMCFQEMFNAAYFCQVQEDEHKDTAEAIPDGPTTQRMIEVAKETGMVLIVPIYEKHDDGFLYNTAAVIDADGTYLGKYRKTHIPQVDPGFYEKFFFKPGDSGWPVFDTAYLKLGVYICYDRHFPEGWRGLALNGAEYIVNPSATVAGLSKYLWELEQPASAAANGVFIGAINRVGSEEPWATSHNMGEFYGSTYIVNPRGTIEAQASYGDDELLVHEIDLDMVREVRNTWQFFRDRRPDSYGPLTDG